MSIGYFVARPSLDDNTGITQFYDRYPVVRALYENVSAWTGFAVSDLLDLALPEEQGQSRSLSMVRSVAAQFAVHDVLAGEGILPSAALGLSLGIPVVSSMSGALARRAAFELLVEWQDLPLPGPDDRPEGIALCRLTPDADLDTYFGPKRQGVYRALDFGPSPDGNGSWVLLSGYRDALQEVAAEKPDVVVLKSTVAGHSPLRRSAAEFVRSVVERRRFADPRIPITDCIEPHRLTTAEAVKEAMWRNFDSSPSIPYGFSQLLEHGVRLLIVPGPSMAGDGIVVYPVPVVNVVRPDDVPQAIEMINRLGVDAAPVSRR